MTTTTPAEQWQVESVPTVGGTIVLSYRQGEVMLQSATPAPGFHTEIEDAGPPEVRVEFESELLTVEVRAEWRDGQLDLTISQTAD